jgi:intracellular sulfur oxidation DsrE/DsrF family protein
MKKSRRNTASEDMIRDFAELKKQGVNMFICTASTSKKTYKSVVKHTAQGVSSYANEMYNKYGDDVAVEVGYFDKDINWHEYCTYRA